MNKIVAVGLMLFLLNGYSSWALGQDYRQFHKTIRFQPGTSVAIMKGAVVRGDRDLYSLRAKAGQKVSVSISSLEQNANFMIYNSRTNKNLPNAFEAERWEGRMPQTGTYVIEVGGTRGNAVYTLKVHIHE